MSDEWKDEGPIRLQLFTGCQQYFHPQLSTGNCRLTANPPYICSKLSGF